MQLGHISPSKVVNCKRNVSILVFRFIEIREKLTPYLKKVGFNPKTDIFYLPVSGLTGINLKDVVGDVCPWYE